VCGKGPPFQNLSRNLYPPRRFLTAGDSAEFNGTARQPSPWVLSALPRVRGPQGRCLMQPSTPLGADQVNVLVLFSDFERMRIVAIWEAQETMERGLLKGIALSASPPFDDSSKTDSRDPQRSSAGGCLAACSHPIADAMRRCPVQPSTPPGPDQVNVLLFSRYLRGLAY
jgi:hypothetical protein